MIDLTSQVARDPDSSSTRSAQALESQDLITRLNRIEGQIRGIRRMVQEARPCIEVLQQVSAAEAALSRISLAVIRHHVDNCVGQAFAQGDSDGREQLTELVNIFDRFAK
jgi:DNA-binding FrmR family transcriptional regulator